MSLRLFMVILIDLNQEPKSKVRDFNFVLQMIFGTNT